MFKMVLGGIITMLLLTTGGAAVVFSGIYNVAATEEHLPFVEPILHSTMHASVEAGAEDIEVPDLDSDSMVQAGAKAYNDLCVACHLKPGLESTVLRAGLNPLPPTFSDSAHQNPAQQFWIVKNGIKMTGMPAWGVTHGDRELWEIVAFLQQLPDMSPADYQAMVAPVRPVDSDAKDDGHDHEHGDTSGMTHSARSSTKPAMDGHDHEHGDMVAMSEQTPAPAPSKKKGEPNAESRETAPRQGSANGNDEEDAASSPSSSSDHYADGHTH